MSDLDYNAGTGFENLSEATRSHVAGCRVLNPHMKYSVHRPWISRARGTKLFIVAALFLGPIAVGNAQDAREPPYLADTSRAMARMMTAMNVGPAGDVDADFVAMMVPHHRGAVEMAQAELRYGRNETLRRIAQGIIIAQLQEIEAMHLALDDSPAPKVALPGRFAPGTLLLEEHRHAP